MILQYEVGFHHRKKIVEKKCIYMCSNIYIYKLLGTFKMGDARPEP